MPISILVRVLNIILWCGRMPRHLDMSKTIFIPKKDNSTDPGDIRPITIPSVIVRQLHTILAKRLTSALSLDSRQRAFIAADRCADNTKLVNLLLWDHQQRHASCYITSLNVSKALDSVSQDVILWVFGVV